VRPNLESKIVLQKTKQLEKNFVEIPKEFQSNNLQIRISGNNKTLTKTYFSS